MDVNGATLWWLGAGLMAAAELATGTFYLLMIGIGFVAAALAAHVGAGATTQLVVAAVVGGGATALCRAWQARRSAGAPPAPASADRDVNLDIGGLVPVLAWGADGCARARYRGTDWTVVYRGAGAPAPGEHRIVEVIGSRLVVAPLA